MAAWPLLVAGAPPSRDGFASGVNGLPLTDEAALDEAEATGFDAVRIFLRWDKIETSEGTPDWTCKYVTPTDLGPDTDGDGRPDPWPGIPCDPIPCGCGYSADERVALTAHGTHHLRILLTIAGTPQWARGRPADGCPVDAPGAALPLRRDKAAAYRNFVAAAAERYGAAVYGFELWNEPDLAGCVSWAGTPEQYKAQILSAARTVKSAGVQPGLVVAPTLEEPSGKAMDTWMDWSAPVDVLSFNLYRTTVPSALAKLDEMADWCGANRRCPGFYITEFGAQRSGIPYCPGPRAARPGGADVAIMKRCRARRRCAGFFLYSLSDRDRRPECGTGLVDRTGCRKRRLCTIARRFFGKTSLPFDCVGCGP